MKLAILSDLHLEFRPFTPANTQADVIVLAGDIHLKRNGVAWARDTFGHQPVLYVPGNHEYYGAAIPHHTNKLKALAAGTNVCILDCDAIEIGGVLFLGATLWTDFRLLGDPRHAGFHATQAMTDYRRIRVSPAFRKLQPIDTAQLHLRARDWLSRSLLQAALDRYLTASPAGQRLAFQVADKYHRKARRGRDSPCAERAFVAN